MADMLQDGVAWLDEMRAAHLSRTVLYARGGASVELAATLGRTEFDVSTAEGLTERFESRDFLVAAAELVLDGQATRPQAGDRVTLGILGQEGVSYVYEVMAPGGRECWRWSDPFQRTIRVYTKLVEEG